MRQRATAQTSIANRGRMSFSPQIAAMYAAGLKGIWRESSRAGVRFVENTGVTPANTPGDALGMILSLDQGLALGPEVLINGDFSAGSTGWTVSGTDATHIATFSGGTLRYQSDTTTPQLLVGATIPPLTSGRLYLVTTQVAGWTSGTIKTDMTGASVMLAGAVGTFVARLLAAATAFTISRATSNVDITIDSISIREILGNHQLQGTTQSRPLYQVGPPRPVFDGVDDVLNTTFASALGANCTVGRFIAGTGAVITTGVNIGTTYADSVTSGPLLIGDRALTAAETQLWTAYLNQQGNL